MSAIYIKYTHIIYLFKFQFIIFARETDFYMIVTSFKYPNLTKFFSDIYNLQKDMPNCTLYCNKCGFSL